MANVNKFSNVNLYELLGIDLQAEQAEIRKAYRKKALACHPDKNPGNPKAAELFHELSNALEILTDATARLAYDKLLKAKKASELRTKQLDSKRQKLREDLQQRESDALYKQQAAHPYTTVQKSDEDVLQEHIIRLRRDGSRLLEEEQSLMREQLLRTMAENNRDRGTSFDSTAYRIKIKWKAEKNDPTNGGYTQEVLQNYLKKYGELSALVISKKVGSALVEFKDLEAAEMALLYEKGLLQNPLRLEWVISPHMKKETQTSTSSAFDYENLVMRKLRQAEERKRLIEQMQLADAAETNL